MRKKMWLDEYIRLDMFVGADHVDDISAEEIEKKIVMRFLQETIEKLNDKEKTDLQDKLKSLDDNLINKELLTSSGLMVC